MAKVEKATAHDGSICGARPGSGPPFGRKVAGCPRCDELLAGAAPRESFTRPSRYSDADAASAIRAHRCDLSGCASVCTFGDW